MKIIEILFKYYDPAYLPILPNMEIFKGVDNLDDLFDAIQAESFIKRNIESIQVIDSRNKPGLTPVKLKKTHGSNGCGLIGFEKLMIARNVYTTPYKKEFEIDYYINDGDQEYYTENEFYCNQCDRTIMRDGGMVIYERNLNYESVCIACLQSEVLADGIPEDVLKNDYDESIWEEYVIMFDSGTIEKNGWSLYSDDISFNYSDHTKIRKLLLKLVHDENKVLVDNWEEIYIKK